MAFNNNVGRNGTMTPTQQPGGPIGSTGPALGWKEMTPQHGSLTRKRRRIFVIVSTILLILLIFTALRFSMVGTSANDSLQIRIGNQQAATLDLNQSFPISPNLFGVNIFPAANTNSIAETSSGFMQYTPVITNGLQDAQIKLLRYPGGEWGEQHILSLDQLNDFSKLLNATHTDGMLQAHLSGPVKGFPKGLTDLNARANFAGTWVDYMNNPKSFLRQGTHAHDAYHPVKFWTIGNEPDLTSASKTYNYNPDTGKPYTVAEYVKAFIEFSMQMHKNNPTIQIFGPEISQFYGVGAGPTDANGALWMDQFLQGIGQYEAANQKQLAALGFHILDGVSFHRYQFNDARNTPALLASSTDEWNYLLPPLRQLIKHDLGRDLPVAITEINSNPGTNDPTHGQSALWWADTLGTLMSQQVQYVAFFSAAGVEHPYPLFSDASTHETAMLRVMQLFSHLQHNLIPLSIQREPISTYATQDDAHQTASLMFVNKGATPQSVQIDPLNQFLTVSSWHSQTLSIAGNSIVVITLQKGTNAATAYSYIVPFNNDPTIQPLTYTVCGHKTDALSTDIPC